jgi:hypothetical protein
MPKMQKTSDILRLFREKKDADLVAVVFWLAFDRMVVFVVVIVDVYISRMNEEKKTKRQNY